MPPAMSAEPKDQSTVVGVGPAALSPARAVLAVRDLPEQLSDEEIARLDPDLHAELFGAPQRPFSVTVVFPVLDSPDYARAVEMAKASAEYRETGTGRPSDTARVSGRPMRRSCAICSNWSGGMTPATCSSTIARSLRARAVAAA